MPTFFENFPVVLVDEQGIVEADIPFRRTEWKYGAAQVGATVELNGELRLDGVCFSDTVKKC